MIAVRVLDVAVLRCRCDAPEVARQSSTRLLRRCYLGGLGYFDRSVPGFDLRVRSPFLSVIQPGPGVRRFVISLSAGFGRDGMTFNRSLLLLFLPMRLLLAVVVAIFPCD